MTFFCKRYLIDPLLCILDSVGYEWQASRLILHQTPHPFFKKSSLTFRSYREALISVQKSQDRFFLVLNSFGHWFNNDAAIFISFDTKWLWIFFLSLSPWEIKQTLDWKSWHFDNQECKNRDFIFFTFQNYFAIIYSIRFFFLISEEIFCNMKGTR